MLILVSHVVWKNKKENKECIFYRHYTTLHSTQQGRVFLEPDGTEKITSLPYQKSAVIGVMLSKDTAVFLMFVSGTMDHFLRCVISVRHQVELSFLQKKLKHLLLLR